MYHVHIFTQRRESREREREKNGIIITLNAMYFMTICKFIIILEWICFFFSSTCTRSVNRRRFLPNFTLDLFKVRFRAFLPFCPFYTVLFNFASHKNGLYSVFPNYHCQKIVSPKIIMSKRKKAQISESNPCNVCNINRKKEI